MKTILAVVAASTFALSGAAFAGGHSNASAAKEMVGNIQEFGGETAAVISPNGDLGGATNGPSDSGWGNAGSRLAPTLGGGDLGTQVSKSGKRRNN